MSRVLPLLVAVPLVGGALCAALRPAAQRFVSFTTIAIGLALSVALVVSTATGEVFATQVGGWPPGFAIALVADPFAALMLAVSMLMVLVCTVFGVARREDQRPLFHPLVLILAAGLAGALLTADLFNLFVFFEVMLIASYVLLTMGGTAERVRAGAVYVTTNMLASTVLIAGVALVYGDTGTVNIAQLGAMTLETGRMAVAGALLLAAFAVKASLVPVHGWLPRAYPAAPPAVAALFAGLLTKVGVYAIYRVYAIVFGGDARFRTLILAIASVTMILGVLGAVGRDGMRDILAFHMVSQVGYILIGLGLFTVFGLAAGIFYMVQYIVVKTGLFLSAGAVESLHGTGRLERLGGLARTNPMLASAFIVSALSLSGIPPQSGFVGKLLLVWAALGEARYLVAAAAVSVSFFTLLSMIKIWTGVFWGEPAGRAVSSDVAPIAGGAIGRAGAGTPAAVMRGAGPWLVAPSVFLALLTLLLGLGAESLFALCRTAAEVLADPYAYIDAVLQP